jgi:predicted alpha-1,2-mannosidase
MISRRAFLGTASATCALSTLQYSAIGLAANNVAARQFNEDPCDLVDPLIGTGGQGHTYPGAAVPFGAVQLSPDTNNQRYCDSGYRFEDRSIMGFSHTHLSGAGAGDLLDFLVMPGTGPVRLTPGSLDHPEEGYRSRFDHEDEQASPGYYSVLLKDYGIRAEMTVTERTGLHRYTFSSQNGVHDTGHVLVDLKHQYEKFGPTILSASLRQIGPDTLAGGRVTNSWAKNRPLYFTMQFSPNPTRVLFYRDDVELPQGTAEGSGTNLKCVLFFDLRQDSVVLVKTGISAVSPENAALNLRHELPGWDFDHVHRAARARWRDHLSRIQVESTNPAQRKIFYTGLYHLALSPTLYDDVDGSYRGMDKQVHQLPPGQHNYTAFSLWDTFRAVHPMFTLIYPERVPDFINTLVRMAEESPAGIPVWPLQSSETGTMTGYDSACVIAEACNKGFKGIDYSRAYTVMRKRAMVDNYRGLQYYRSMHYIPADLEVESVSKTLEYCYDDWSVAHVAQNLGHTADAKLLAERSLNYRNCYDTKLGFARPRLANGSWVENFDATLSNLSGKWRDFTESNSWQTTFGILHDPAGLIALLGGPERFISKLDELFVQASGPARREPDKRHGRVGEYDQSNEPSHHIAFLYAWAGQPWKTQQRIRMLLETTYTTRPDGLCGNDDLGQMSAWYLTNSMGFYPVDPVSGNYIFGAPLFDKVTVRIEAGRHLRIETRRTSPSDQYIRSITLNGKACTRSWFHHHEVAKGGTIVFEMGSEPNHDFGSRDSDLPPSFELQRA